MNPEKPSLADRRDTETVYQPAEDSKLLADAAIGGIQSTDRVLDVGTGSGYVARRVAEATGAVAVGSDLNPHACRQAHAGGVPAVRANLVAPFRADSFEVVVCNPPYLPTDPDSGWGDWMERALSGGPDGRAVVEPLLDDLRRVLTPDGRAFLLVSSLTGIGAVRTHARANGLTSAEVAEESHPHERLVVLDLRPSSPGDN